MKIANRHAVIGLGLLTLGFTISPVAAWAGPPPSSMDMMPNASAVPAMPESAAPAVAPKIVPPMIMASAPSMGIPTLPSPVSGLKKNTEIGDGKIPDSVKDVIKRLNSGTEDITLDNLNAAREAVAKLDALIEIEKRMADLDKLRQEREKGNNRMLAAAIPSSMLAPPPSFAPPSAPPPSHSMAFSSGLHVERIEGSNSHYAALIKEGDQTHLVHAGDHLADGSVVRAITTRSVELEKGKTTHVVQIENVQAVFGDSP